LLFGILINVLREILELSSSSDYDFRESACAEDPLRHLFPEWVHYYRTKWAIARYLQPTSILEIGVRYGYSAQAFLHACPNASYLGLDADSNTHGGVRGAIHWARNATRGHRADFLIADSQAMVKLPGGEYDLIHVDGQQDGDGSLHDLELALSQGRFILFDGYFWTRDNFLAASEFLYRNRDLLRFYGVILGYAGELLIKTKTPLPKATAAVESSEQLRNTYTEDYYLLDCGGFNSYKKSRGLDLEDSRLRAVAQIANVAPRGRALDLGCGRGEISLNLARNGYDVTAVDYSGNAIKLAIEAERAAADPCLQIHWHCVNVADCPLEGTYHVAVASDLIEHLTPAELEKLYSNVATHLAPTGLFVVHTFPNLWFYKYEYARKLRAARSLGAYLPKEPRTRYEKLMHINEQSPRVLHRQLRAHFDHVLLWFADHDLNDPARNLRQKFRISEMRAAGDLFAIASHSEIDTAFVASEFSMTAIALEAGQFQLGVVQASELVKCGSEFTVDVYVSNRSPIDLKSKPPFPVHLSYHWFDAQGKECLIFDGRRTVLHEPLRRFSSRNYQMVVQSPPSPGRYLLRVTLVQEQVQWFDSGQAHAACDTWVLVS
jgi:2-polyprenyl-3-methyl-5-hydroxy-6-metoxy-1,4-benzoquinol methylase